MSPGEVVGRDMEPLPDRPGYMASPTDWARYANHLENEIKALRDAAMWVVLTWDTEQSQHHTMPSLRRALGLLGEPPTREEAQERMNAYMASLLASGDSESREETP
jgi:hypothetical protein